MKTKLITVISAVGVASFALVFAGMALAQGGGMIKKPNEGGNQPSSAVSVAGSKATTSGNAGTPITAEEAAKKYPIKGKYPMGERDPHKPSGVVISPYPPHVEYDCSNIAHGGLVLDKRANKVFIRP